MALLTNPVLVSVIVLCVLCLLKLNVLMSLIIAAMVGAVLGGICQIIGYQSVKIVLISPAAALATIPTITTQTVAGIIIAAVVITVLQSSKVIYRLQRM